MEKLLQPIYIYVFLGVVYYAWEISQHLFSFLIDLEAGNYTDEAKRVFK